MRDLPSSVLQRLLTNKALDLFTLPHEMGEWPLYAGSLPFASDIKINAGCLYDTAGTKDGRIMEGTNDFHYGLQLRIRCRSKADGWKKIVETCNYLETMFREVVEMDEVDVIVQNVSQATPVLPLGEDPDAANTYNFTANFMVSLKEEEEE